MLSEDSECLAKAGRPPAAEIGDIDLLVRIGSTVLLGEVKCMSHPATSHDWFRHRSRLREAVDQVKRKADWARSNLGWLEGIFSGHQVNRVVECIVVNTFRSSMAVAENVPVSDTWLLYRYLAEGHGMMFVSDNGEGGGDPARA